MNFCSLCSEDLHSVNILFLCNFKLVGGESESAFFFSLWSVHFVILKPLAVNDPKDAIIFSCADKL